MIGKRIRQARMAAGLTLKEVSERLADEGRPITRACLSKYETGKSMPGATFLVDLARVLSVKTKYFLVDPSVEVSWLSFRGRSRLTIRTKERIKAYAEDVVERQLRLQEMLTPGFRPVFPRQRQVRTFEQAEEAAAGLRRTWKVGLVPIESLTQLAEDRGLVVVGWSGDSSGFDGLCGRANRRFPVAVVTTRVQSDRRRYNLAHELGHLVMDREGLPAKKQESLAHRFAAALLVPPEIARQELGQKRRHLGMDELAVLKRKYGMSMQGWARRARDLGIVSAGRYRRLCIEFSARGWRKVEPVFFHGSEEPTRMRQMAMRALAEGIITPEKFEDICGSRETDGGTSAAGGPESWSAAELLRLPEEERGRVLMLAAAEAQAEYRTDRDLTDFEAFGEGDLGDDSE